MKPETINKLGTFGLIAFCVGGLTLVVTCIYGFDESSDAPTSTKRKWAYGIGAGLAVAGGAALGLVHIIETTPAQEA